MAEIFTTQELKLKVQAAYRAAYIYSLPHGALQDMLNSIRQELSRKVGTVKPRMRYSVEQQGFIKGVIQIESDRFYKNALLKGKFNGQPAMVYAYNPRAIFFRSQHGNVS